MSLLQTFKGFISSKHLFSTKDKLLLAVSGGVDSIVLCELCNQAGFDFKIAHCNFQLRGEESDRDEQFVRNLGKKYGVEVKVKKFDTENYAAEKKRSIQEAARELRYSWFADLINHPIAIGSTNQLINQSTNQPINQSTNQPINPSTNQPLNYLLTAHHADDNAETVLMNFCRGTGLHGLTGIPVSINHIRRPLLCFSKDDLMRFANKNKLEFVEDSSNKSSKYTRNHFRNEIIPAISKVYPQVKTNLQDNAERFNEIDRLYKYSVNELKKKLFKQKGREIHVPVKQFMAFQNRALIYEIIAPFGFSEKQVDEVLKLAESESGRYITSPANEYRIIRHRHWFIISPVETTAAENIIIGAGTRDIEFTDGRINLEVFPNSRFPIPNSNKIGIFDLKTIQFPLLLRKWKAGDYFYPLGMKKKKKVARFLIDQKLSKTDKEKIWVLEMNSKILWVVGHRIDDRFKIRATTKDILSITPSLY